MTRFRLSFICCFLLSVLSISAIAQTREGARRQMNNGNYSNAVTILSALDELYPGQYSKELSVAKKCLNLQRTAKSKLAANQYTEAEDLYNQILKLNPSDKTVSQSILQCQQERDKFLTAELEKCTTISAYRAFASKYPNTPQSRIASAKVNDYDLEQQDKSDWGTAVLGGSIASYTQYISKARSYSKHLADAYKSRAKLYFSQAQSATTDETRRMNYSLAKDDYDKARSNKATFLPVDDNNYLICTAEGKFYELGKQPAYSQVSSYLTWTEDYLSKPTINSHLHIKEANALLVGALCDLGYFKDARDFIDLHYGEITCSVFTLSSSGKEWTKNEWKTFIKGREKAFKKRSNSSPVAYSSRSYSSYSPKSYSAPVETMWGLGLGYNGSGFSSDGYFCANVTFSIGTFDNVLNCVFSVTPGFTNPFEYSSTQVKFLCPLTVGPGINIVRPIRHDFYLSLRGEVGYCLGASGVYGGKLLFGWAEMFGIGIEVLGSMKPLSSDYIYDSRLLYGGLTVNYYF